MDHILILKGVISQGLQHRSIYHFIAISFAMYASEEKNFGTWCCNSTVWPLCKIDFTVWCSVPFDCAEGESGLNWPEKTVAWAWVKLQAWKKNSHDQWQIRTFFIHRFSLTSKVWNHFWFIYHMIPNLSDFVCTTLVSWTTQTAAD